MSRPRCTPPNAKRPRALCFRDKRQAETGDDPAVTCANALRARRRADAERNFASPVTKQRPLGPSVTMMIFGSWPDANLIRRPLCVSLPPANLVPTRPLIASRFSRNRNAFLQGRAQWRRWSQGLMRHVGVSAASATLGDHKYSNRALRASFHCPPTSMRRRWRDTALQDKA